MGRCVEGGGGDGTAVRGAGVGIRRAADVQRGAVRGHKPFSVLLHVPHVRVGVHGPRRPFQHELRVDGGGRHIESDDSDGAGVLGQVVQQGELLLVHNQLLSLHSHQLPCPWGPLSQGHVRPHRRRPSGSVLGVSGACVAHHPAVRAGAQASLQSADY